MTNRERLLKALKHGIPDVVPFCPDISIMIPLRMKKRPFWDSYLDHIDENEGYFYDLYGNDDLLQAYLDACRYLGVAVMAYLYAKPEITKKDVQYDTKIISKKDDKITTRTTMHTPEGDLYSETVYFKNDPPFHTKKFIDDFKEDFKFLKYFYPDLDEVDFSTLHKERELIGDDGVNGVIVLPPSLVHLDNYINGGLGAIGLLYYDYPELIKEYKLMHEEWTIKYVEKIIESKSCDMILTGGSGLMTWQSPKITRDLSFDSIKQITKMCKKDGIISNLHCCGFSKELVKMCAEETDLDAMEPLEIPPQGDCDLKELKQKYGDKIVLKGNLQTTDVMLSDVKTVEKEAIKCIEDAAEGGSFILSTGDQCGRDTPFENLFKCVEVCEKYGKY